MIGTTIHGFEYDVMDQFVDPSKLKAHLIFPPVRVGLPRGAKDREMWRPYHV
jgi:hypothetical protein